MFVDEVNVNPSQEGALQSASVTDTDMGVPSASAGATPIDSLTANPLQPELQGQLPPAAKDDNSLAHLYHLFPELSKFKLNPPRMGLPNFSWISVRRAADRCCKAALTHNGHA